MEKAQGDFVTSKYINPYTDFGFKKLFGTPLNKDLLISFLNALFDKAKDIRRDKIVDVQYLNTEQLGRTEADRKAVFDVYCQTKKGAKFIVEMQNAFQDFFKDRSLYYASFPLRDMAKKDTKDEKWNYELQPLYTVGILNFVFKDEEQTDKDGKPIKGSKVIQEESDDEFRHDVMLVDVTNNNKVFYNKLVFTYLEMPKYKKTIEQCKTLYDKWIFVLKNLSRLLERPKELQERIFKRVFEQAEIARYTPEEHLAYQESLKNYWDFGSVESSAINTGIRRGRAQGLAEGRAQGRIEGLAEGRAQGRIEGRKEGIEKGRAEGEHQAKLALARSMKADNIPIETIVKYTGLTIDEINKL